MNSGERWLENHHEKLLKIRICNATDLSAPNGAMNGNLLVPSDTERSDGVAGLGEDWGLTSQRLQHL